MRLLHLVHSYPPLSRGGTETYVSALASAQVAAGHRVRILAGSDASDFEERSRLEDAGGIELVRVHAPERSLARLAGLEPLARSVLEEELRAHRPDLVHLHHWHNLSADVVRAARAAGIPTAVTLHDYFATCPFFFRLPDAAHVCPPDLERDTCVRCVGRIAGDPPQVIDELLVQRWAHFRAELEAASARIVLSQAQADFLRAFPAFASIEFEVLRLPAPPLPPVHETAANARLSIASWGGLERGKGLGTLLEACELLPDPAAVEVHHHGRILDTAFADEVRGLARRTPLTLHGAFAAEDLGSFARYDLAVFPSFFLETHGYSVDEALGLGLPVIVSDRGAPAERVGTRGRVVPAGDARALSAVLARLLADPGELAAMRAGEALPGATLEAHAEALERVYARALV